MEKFIWIWILLISLFFQSTLGAGKMNVNSLHHQLNHIVSDEKNIFHIGVLVQDAQTRKVIFQKNSSRYFEPASNQKIITAFAARNYLPEDFVYQTKLFVDKNKIKDGVLSDNLYFQFSGDPTLSFLQLDHLIKQLAEQGIHQINGKMIVDDSAFDNEAMSPGSSWDDALFCWSAPINTVVVDGNCVRATLLPADKIGANATIANPDFPQSMTFITDVKTGNDNEAIKIEKVGTKKFRVQGAIKLNQDPLPIALAINDPRENIEFLIRSSLEKNGIQINDKKLLFKKFQLQQPPFAVENSQTLPSIITSMLKNSDNLIADTLFKTIGFYNSHDLGTFKTASTAVREIVQKESGVQISNKTLLDGSGRSRYNFLTPKQIVSLLQKIYDSNDREFFMQALPISGVDGTLKNRLDSLDEKGRVHAKTGSETGVTTLSGFLTTRQNKTLVFSIMINNFTEDPKKYQTLEDDICKILINAL